MKTSYFAMMRNFPDTVEPIAICAKVPNWYNGKVYKKLAPSYQLLMDYKKTGDEKTYTEKYNNYLKTLNVQDVIKDFEQLSNGKEIILLCYEKSSDFCHRHLVANWLNENGYSCEEWENGE